MNNNILILKPFSEKEFNLLLDEFKTDDLIVHVLDVQLAYLLGDYK